MSENKRKRLTTAEIATVNTARDLLTQAHNQVVGIGEDILVRSIQSVRQLDRIRADHVLPLIGLIDGFTALTVQAGNVAKKAREDYQEKVKNLDEDDYELDGCCDDDNNTVKVPQNKAPDFNHKQYKCVLDQARAHLANAYTLLSNPQLDISPTTPVPSVDGAMGRSGGGSDRVGSRH